MRLIINISDKLRRRFEVIVTPLLSLKIGVVVG